MTSARNLFPRSHGAQRRQEPRFEVRLPVTVLSSPAKEQLVTWDVSFRGMFIECVPHLAVRQLVRLSVFMPTTGREIVVHGMVVNHVDVDDPEGRPQGMGVELYGLDPEARGAWWGLVRFVRDRLHELEGPRPSGDRPSAVRPSAVRLRAVP